MLRMVFVILVLLFIHGTFSNSSETSEGEIIEYDQLFFAHVVSKNEHISIDFVINFCEFKKNLVAVDKTKLILNFDFSNYLIINSFD